MAQVRDAVLALLRQAEEPGAAAAVVASAPALDPWLREIVRCPVCKAALRAESGPTGPELVCTAPGCGLAYPIDAGIPVLLPDLARRPG